MRVRLPDKFTREELEDELNRALESVVGSAKLNEITAAGTIPLDVAEREIFFRRDGQIRELIVRDQGKTFKLTMTEV